MTDAGRHPQIDILAYTEVKTIEGDAGNYTVFLKKKPRYVNADLCKGCRTCALYCPVSLPNPFDENLSYTKAINIAHAQAIPAVSTIQDEQCLFLGQKKCKICFPICKHRAIDFTQKEEEIQIKVGAIIVSSGFDIFDSMSAGEYGYGKIKNVVNGLEFERFLSAEGPSKGEVLRPSDGKVPGKIAWLQCVGSRTRRRGNSYCSGICCAYAIKQVVMVKDHYPQIKASIFGMDIRTYGKGVESLYNKTQKMEGVEFVRKRIPNIKENPQNSNLIIRYVSDDHKIHEEEFEMGVLSVGMIPAKGNETLAKVLGIHLNQYGFCRTHILSPNESNRPGIFPAATFTGPMDIPDSISSVSGAASLAAQMLYTKRRQHIRSFPKERLTEREETKIGVFVCHCGTNIRRVVDVPAVVQYASQLKNVIHCEEQTFSCASDSCQRIADTIRVKGLNRVVVAACTPRTHESLFQETLREAGINKYLIEMANIREHCSWVHSLEKDKATLKAMDIISMSVARANHLFPLKEIEIPVNKKGLILGAGLAGMKAALSLARQGFHVYLVEREKEIGGNLRKIRYTLDGVEVQLFLEKLKKEIENEEKIEVIKGYELISLSGFVGNYKSRLRRVNQEFSENLPNAALIDLEHGIIIVATGGRELTPEEYQYGKTERIMTQQELENRVLSTHSIKNLKKVVMIQCVGARNEERPYCGRICCGEAIKNALKLKQMKEDVEISIFYRDIRTYGFMEDYYAQAREKGILFFRYEPEKPPKIDLKGENLSIIYWDSILGTEGEIHADWIILSAPVSSKKQNSDLSRILRVPVTADGFFMEAHLKLRPLDFATEGIFLCGLAHYPKFIPETISQANGAALRAATILSKDTILASGIIAEIDEKKCVGCGLCQRVCSYGAIQLQEDKLGKKAMINAWSCKGCGACVSKCPNDAIILNHFTDLQLMAQIDAAFSVFPQTSEPKVLAFLCNWCGYAAADLAGVSRFQFPSNFRVIRVMCSARISVKLIAASFLKGIDAVLIVGCRLADCHYISGIQETVKMVASSRRMLEKAGINQERLRLEQISAAEGGKFAEAIKLFTNAIKQLGPLELTEDKRVKLIEVKLKKARSKKETRENGNDAKFTY